MKKFLAICSLVTAFAFVSGDLAFAGKELNINKKRVPKADRVAAKKHMAPFGIMKKGMPADVVAAGKKLFGGKGTCVNCHGIKGDGQGVAGKPLNPGPRNFTNCKFQKKRKDGELFYVVKNGSALVAAMAPFGKNLGLSDDEIWSLVAYERSFCKHKKNYKVK